MRPILVRMERPIPKHTIQITELQHYMITPTHMIFIGMN